MARFIAQTPLNNGTWVPLPDGRWERVALPMEPYHRIDEGSEDFIRLVNYQPITVPTLAPYYMVQPRYFNNGSPAWRGRMIARADGGSIESWGTADIWHAGFPWVYLRGANVGAPYPWIPDLARGRDAWFTPDGRDLRQICRPPVRDQNVLLVFDMIGDVRVGTPTAVVIDLPHPAL